MRVQFRATKNLLKKVREDLRRSHLFAYERGGFISAGVSSLGSDVLILARDYTPICDDDYLRDNTVGAMMGTEAIRKALEWAMLESVSLFHVHTHGGHGIPYFSSIDTRESAKFVPDFFKVAPACVHGAIVLSEDAARGLVWLDHTHPAFITEFTEIGMPIRKWGQQ